MKIPIMMLILLISQSFAVAGKVGTGGGNLRPATEQEIAEAIEIVWKGEEHFEYYVLKLSYPKTTVYPKPVSNILAKWYDRKYFTDSQDHFAITKAVWATKVTIKTEKEGYCLHNGKPQAATVEIEGQLENLISRHISAINQKVIKLCYSIPLLKKRLQASNTIQAIRAITLHEYAHVFGFNEADSQQLEDYFVGTGKKQAENILQLQRAIGLTEGSLRFTIGDLKEGSSDASVCTYLAMVHHHSMKMKSVMESNTFRTHPKFDQMAKLNVDIMSRVIGLMGFCGRKEIYAYGIHPYNYKAVKPVNEADRVDLTNQLKIVHEEMLPQMQKLAEY